MSTTQNFTVNRGLPYNILIRAPEKFDEKQTQIFTTNNQSVSVNDGVWTED